MKQLITSLFFLFCLNGFAQKQICSSTPPSFEHLEKIKKLNSSHGFQKSGPIRVIPVVFHVLHEFGIENISDAQILDQMIVLNRDFQKMNEDTSLVVSPFDTIIGNTGFEFRLATIDPNGNPTNGIDRIVTSLTNNADENSKINPWNPQQYINIWVVKNTAFNAYVSVSNPLNGYNPCDDGILLRHDVIGRFGTSSEFGSRSLTHSLGHFFGLYHMDNGTISSSGDCNYSDGIYDTPITTRVNTCLLSTNTCDDSNDTESFAYWGFDPNDNIQNYMSFHYCSLMFTKGQSLLMRNVLESPLYGRNNLFTDSNLISTGTQNTIPFISMPYSDFVTSSPIICVNNSVQLYTSNIDTSNTVYEWSFPGGNPSSSSFSNPTVFYSAPGFYSITLIVTTPLGSDTTIQQNIVYVSASWPEFTGSTVQNFDADPIWWITESPFDEFNNFERSTNKGVGNSGCYVLNNLVVPDSSVCGNSQNQLNEKIDNLISPSFDLGSSSNITVTFDYAYATDSSNGEKAEELKVYSSRDCGQTWLLKTSLKDSILICTTSPIGSSFIPSSNDWRTKSFNYTSNSNDSKTRFKFEFKASNFSNNLYIDNFRIEGILGTNELNNLSTIQISPNPILAGEKLAISVQNSTKVRSVQIYDLAGKIVSNHQNLDVNKEFIIPVNLDAGYYIVYIQNGGSTFSEKLCVQ